MQIDRFYDKYPHMSTYQYAANNPANFIDVNGDSIDVSHLSAYVQLWLTSSLYQITGVELGVNENGMLAQVEGSKINENGTSGSARNDLMYSIGHEDILSVKAKAPGSTEPSRCDCQNEGSTIYLNLDQIMFNEENSEGVSSLTQGIGMTFMHELNHSSLGFNRVHTPHDKKDVNVYSDPILSRGNLYRREIGTRKMGQRLTYGMVTSDTKFPYTPFKNGKVYSNWSTGPFPYKKMIQRW